MESEDYSKLKAQRTSEREEIRAIKDSLCVGNSLDKFFQAVTGQNTATDEPYEYSSPSVTRKIASKTSQPEVHTSSKYGEVISELERFRFSSDEEKRKKQFAAISITIRSALQDLIVKDVAQNTKQAFKDHVIEPVYKVSGGIKIIYNFGGQKVAVAARGAFFGDETIYISREGDKIKGGVARTGLEGELEDISGNYSITVERV